MTNEKTLVYKKAYVELLEVLKLLSYNEQSKIPENFLKYIANNRDQNYTFYIDDSKDLLEQNFMVETKALIVQIYKNFLLPEEEKEFWMDYDKICLNMIECEKKKKYNVDIFEKSKNKANELNNIENQENTNIEVAENSTDTQLIEYKEPFFTRFKRFIFKILHIS